MELGRAAKVPMSRLFSGSSWGEVYPPLSPSCGLGSFLPSLVMELFLLSGWKPSWLVQGIFQLLISLAALLNGGQEGDLFKIQI